MRAAADAAGQLDPLLECLVLPHAPSERAHLLEELIEREARPVIRAVVRRELRGQEQFDGWTFKSAPGWIVREGARRGDHEVVRQQP